MKAKNAQNYSSRIAAIVVRINCAITVMIIEVRIVVWYRRELFTTDRLTGGCIERLISPGTLALLAVDLISTAHVVEDAVDNHTEKKRAQ